VHVVKYVVQQLHTDHNWINIMHTGGGDGFSCFIAPNGARARCEHGLNTIRHVVRSMGLVVNTEKEEMGQTLIFLGTRLSSIAKNGTACSVGLTEKRRQYVAEQCQIMEHTSTIQVSKLMSFAGLLIFCAQVMFGAKLYLRSAFALIGSRNRRSMVRLSEQFRMDCAWWRTMVTQMGECGTLLQRRFVSSRFASWDASLTWGIGGFFDGKYFSVPWEHYTSGRHNNDVAPIPGSASWHINYMEAFACFIFLTRFGRFMRGYTVICHTDSTTVKAWLTTMWGPTHVIPLLKRIHLMMLRFDIRFEVHWLSSKNNILSDLLSRGEMRAFFVALAEYMRANDSGGLSQ